MPNKKVEVYAYVMTNADGFAPCVEDKLLTLACCKTNLRYQIGKKYNTHKKAFFGRDQEEREVFVIGLCGKQPAIINGTFDMMYYPVYIARITSALSVKEYHSEKYSGRKDQQYECKNGVWYSKASNPHSDYHAAAIDDGQKLDGNYQKLVKRDIFFKGNKSILNYVLLSEDYAYFGSSLNQVDFPKTFGELKDIIVNKKLYMVGFHTDNLTDDRLKLFQEFFSNCRNKNISNIKGLEIQKTCSSTSKCRKKCGGC